METKSGIYRIYNIVSGKTYVGSAKCLNKRKNTHFTQLSKGIHHNSYLQNSYNKYGLGEFKYEVLEYCSLDSLIEREQYWIDFYGLENLYNICPKAYSRLNSPVSLETREKISKANKGRIKSEEEKLKLSKANLGKKMSEETKEKLRQINQGKTYSEETKEKHRLKAIENNSTQYLKKGIGTDAPHFGKRHSEEVKARMSKAHKNISEETRKKMSEAKKGNTNRIKNKFLGETDA